MPRSTKIFIVAAVIRTNFFISLTSVFRHSIGQETSRNFLVSRHGKNSGLRRPPGSRPSWSGASRSRTLTRAGFRPSCPNAPPASRKTSPTFPVKYLDFIVAFNKVVYPFHWYSHSLNSMNRQPVIGDSTFPDFSNLTSPPKSKMTPQYRGIATLKNGFQQLMNNHSVNMSPQSSIFNAMNVNFSETCIQRLTIDFALTLQLGTKSQSCECYRDLYFIALQLFHYVH